MGIPDVVMTPAMQQARAEMLRHLGQRIGRISAKLVKHAYRSLTRKSRASLLKTDKPLQHFSGKGK